MEKFKKKGGKMFKKGGGNFRRDSEGGIRTDKDPGPSRLRKIGVVGLLIIALCLIGIRQVRADSIDLTGLKNEVDVLKDWDWKGSLGGIVLKATDEDNARQEAVSQFYESPHKYFNLNGIYPDILGISANANLKKMGGDLWFKYCIKLDEETREKLEQRYSFFKFIRLDIGGFIGVKRDWEEKHGYSVKIVEFSIDIETLPNSFKGLWK